MRTIPGATLPARIALLLLTCLSATGCNTYVEHHLDRGDVAYNEGRYRDAIDEYVKAVRFGSNNVRAVRQLGLAYFKAGDLGSAAGFLGKAVTLAPNNAEVHLRLGQVFLADHQPDKALQEAQAMLGIDPRSLEAYSLLGSAYLAQKDAEKSVTAYRSFVELAPANAQGHYMLARSLLAAKQIDDARKELDTTLQLDKGYVDAVARLVELDLADKQPDAAIERVERQMQLAGRLPKLLILLGAADAARGDAAGAEAAYREALRLDPKEPDAGVALASLYVNAGKVDRALAVLDTAELSQPRNVNAFVLQGAILQSKGNIPGARRAYEQALSIDPRHAVAANDLAWVLSEKFGEDRKAYDLASVAVDEEPENPHFGDTLGWILYRTGNYGRASSVLKEAVAKAPNDPVIGYHYALALERIGDRAGAREVLTRVMNSATPFADREAAQKALSALR